jgi:hypothetical protein
MRCLASLEFRAHRRRLWANVAFEQVRRVGAGEDMQWNFQIVHPRGGYASRYT